MPGKGDVTLKIPRQLYEKLQVIIADTGFHSVTEFVKLAFARIGIDNWRQYVVQDPRLFRPLDILDLCGDYSKARSALGWKPTTRFEELVNLMVDADLQLVKASESALG